MTIKVTFQGIDITVATTAEAAEVARALASGHATNTIDHVAPIVRHRTRRARSAKTETDFDVYDTTIKFLSAIESAPHGLRTNQILPLVRAEHVKGIGARAAKINALIDEKGFQRYDVYSNDKDQNGKRVWKSGPRIRAVLEAVKQSRSSKG